jgi:prepilin-type N-terminal cleavage/methylation domain-containing protein
MKNNTPKPSCQTRLSDTGMIVSRERAQNFRKKAAFTLAEVLITLGIVGVVAAMTIPTLITNCQKVVWAKQAQKEYATLTQVFKSILADNNTTSITETELWSKIEDEGGVDTGDTNFENDFWTEFGKYVKISSSIKSKNKEYYNSDDRSETTQDETYQIYLPSGVQIYRCEFLKTPSRKSDDVCAKIKALGGSVCSYIGYLDIDVNGDKGPNIIGRDIFEFSLSDEGILYPMGGKDYALYQSQTDLASNSAHWKNIYNGTKEENSEIDGWYRTGQLMEEGWKMNY